MDFSTTAVAAHLHRHRRLIELCRLFVSYSAVQAVAQGLGLLAGIMIIRSLKKEEYAYYTIANTLGTMMILLSDTGISNSLSAIGGRFWQDDQKMGGLIKTGMVLRRQLVLLSLLVMMPVMIWMLLRNHAPLATVVWLILLAAVGAFFQLNTGVLYTVVSLRQQVGRLQSLVLVSVLPRLALIALFAILGILNAPLAVAAAGCAFAVQFLLLRHWVKPQIAWNAPPDAECRRDILAIVKQQAPQVVYYCLQNQVSIWLISIFGNVRGVAEVGALGRIGTIFSILGTTTGALIVPRFARCQDPARLRRLYALIIISFGGILTLGVFFAWLFPAPLLWLLGPQYAKLRDLIALSVLTSAIWSLSGLVYALNVNRGWITPAMLIIPAEIIAQIILCLSFDLSTVRGVYMISALTPVVPGLINLAVGLRRLNSKPLPDDPK
jgi:O-antigen/teichoic acid export membrane protein